MKPSKSGDEVRSTVKATTKYSFLPPGAIGKGRGRGRSLRSMISLGVSGDGVRSSHQSSLYASKSANPLALEKETMQSDFLVPTDQVMKYIKSQSYKKRSDSTPYDGQKSGMDENPLVNEEEHMELETVAHPFTDHIQYSQTVETSAIGKGRGQGKSVYDTRTPVSTISKSTSPASSISAGQGMRTTIKNPLVSEKEHMQWETTFPSTDHLQYSQTVETRKERGRGKPVDDAGTRPASTISTGQGMRTRIKSTLVSEKEHMQWENTDHMQYSQKVETSAIGKERGGGKPVDDAGTRPASTITIGQGIGTTIKNPSVSGKEHIQTDTTLPLSSDQVKTNAGSSTPGKVKRLRGKNKCEEVTSLEVGEKLKVTFYNNRTVGKNSNLFSRNLGKLVRDRNMCPLGVSSWHEIKEDKLNHMWAAVEDKFESDVMLLHREHVLDWMKELSNRWRGQMHAKYVRGKPIQEALRNMPKGVNKKQWEWLVKEHFSTETFQARSNRNAKNRAKLKMHHHIGSKPIREIIYQKGGKDCNPPDLGTIFFETRKKNNTLVDSEATEKHAQIQELVQSKPSLATIEVVEKCFGPQKRSHVFGFGGGVKAKDLKGGLFSKAELLSELHSSREENQSLRDRLPTLENQMKEVKQLKELFLAQHSKAQPSTSSILGE